MPGPRSLPGADGYTRGQGVYNGRGRYTIGGKYTRGWGGYTRGGQGYQREGMGGYVYRPHMGTGIPTPPVLSTDTWWRPLQHVLLASGWYAFYGNAFLFSD